MLVKSTIVTPVAINPTTQVPQSRNNVQFQSKKSVQQVQDKEQIDCLAKILAEGDMDTFKAFKQSLINEEISIPKYWQVVDKAVELIAEELYNMSGAVEPMNDKMAQKAQYLTEIGAVKSLTRQMIDTNVQLKTIQDKPFIVAVYDKLINKKVVMKKSGHFATAMETVLSYLNPKKDEARAIYKDQLARIINSETKIDVFDAQKRRLALNLLMNDDNFITVEDFKPIMKFARMQKIPASPGNSKDQYIVNTKVRAEALSAVPSLLSKVSHSREFVAELKKDLTDIAIAAKDDEVRMSSLVSLQSLVKSGY